MQRSATKRFFFIHTEGASSMPHFLSALRERSRDFCYSSSFLHHHLAPTRHPFAIPSFLRHFTRNKSVKERKKIFLQLNKVSLGDLSFLCVGRDNKTPSHPSYTSVYSLSSIKQIGGVWGLGQWFFGEQVVIP